MLLVIAEIYRLIHLNYSGLTLLSHPKKVRDASQGYYYVLNFSKRHTPYNKKCADCVSPIIVRNPG
jgi:hypothetical protein